jgi:formylglycine-generating enzyme required for sulfatase activity
MLTVAADMPAAERPPYLDCTGPNGADAETVRASQIAWAKYMGESSHEKAFPLDKAGKVKIEMVLVPPGKYYRGEEKKAMLITLTQPLWVGKYEVTQQQYAAVMDRNPAHFKEEGTNAALYPVETVSHVQASNFCRIASANSSGQFRLLREAEWEYAYRAGTRTKWYNGDSEEMVGEIAQFHGTNFKRSEKVGTKKPNAFGIYDMAGNVWEWVSDPWSGQIDKRTTIDPVGPETGQGFVTRGSSWSSSAQKVSATYRSRDAGTYGGSHLGFRLAQVPSAVNVKAPPSAAVVKAPPSLDCTGPKGADAKAVVASQRAWAKYLREPDHVKSFPLDKDGVTVEMVLLPPGKYCQGKESSPTIVILTQPLWVSRYEVTQYQYEAVMGTNPAHFKRSGAAAGIHPVESVSHVSAVEFCSSVSKNTGSQFRLLWQAEWEYAYRAGTRTKFYNGDSNDGVFEIAQCTENNFRATAHVGSKLPNAFGIYDMAGNVSEWCADRWQSDYQETTTTDPRGPKTGTIYVHRGRAWDSYGRTCNATARGLSTEQYGGSQLGFRLARVADRNE